MNIPKQLKIGGHVVKVRVEDDIPTMAGYMGDSWAAHNSIRICSVYPESQQAATLLHEILHHVLNNLGHSYSKDDDDSKDVAIHSERNVEAISQGLFQVLRDNKLDFSEAKSGGRQSKVVITKTCDGLEVGVRRTSGKRS